YWPPFPAVGVPDKIPVPSPWSTKLRLPGSAVPPMASDGVEPAVVTVKLPNVPTLKVVAFALVIDGGHTPGTATVWKPLAKMQSVFNRFSSGSTLECEPSPTARSFEEP